jgi:hypothetical protein
MGNTKCRRGVRTHACVAAVLCTVPLAWPARAAEVASNDTRGKPGALQAPIALGPERQLFIDDDVIASMQGIRRTFHPVTKFAGNPILIPEKPWETQARSILPLTVLRDPNSGSLRVWYSAWGKQVDKPTYMCVADSTDGIHWTRPDLGLVDFEGSRHNNIIREGRMFRVLYDPRDPDPSRRYKAIIRDAGFLAGFSPDGLRWKTTVPVLQKAFDATSVHWDPAGSKWIASCKVMHEGKRARGYAESKDFVHWTDVAFMMTVDDKDGPADQLYSMAIARYESLYVGLLKVYHTDSDRCDVQVAFSRDARRWKRPERRAFLPNAAAQGQWDYGNIDPPEHVLRMGDELWFYYSGRSTLHNQKPNDGAMGLATLRVDGFASLDAGGEQGIMLIRPVVLKGKSLYVNADAKGGEVRAEILSSTPGHPDGVATGFSMDQCSPIHENAVRQELTWRGSTGVESLTGKPIRLRFHIRNARLYAIWTE